MQVDFKVVQLLSSRLCHDLVGPAGAVQNGIELFRELGSDEDNSALDIVALSGEQLSARLAFFRMTFGLGGFSGNQTPLVEAHDLTQSFLAGSHISLDWPVESCVNIGRAIKSPVIKLLLNMILVAVDGLPRGGVIKISLEIIDNLQDELKTTMLVNASGSSACLSEDLQFALSVEDFGQANEVLSARNIHGFFCQRLAEEMSSKIEFSSIHNKIQLAVSLPDTPNE